MWGYLRFVGTAAPRQLQLTAEERQQWQIAMTLFNAVEGSCPLLWLEPEPAAVRRLIQQQGLNLFELGKYDNLAAFHAAALRLYQLDIRHLPSGSLLQMAGYIYREQQCQAKQR